MTALRSVLFALALLLITPPYALLALATFPLPRLARYRIISGWSRLVIHLARALLMSGRAATARRLLEALAEPLEAEAALERRLYLARACARTGAIPEAVALLQELVGRRPENPAYRHELHRIRNLRAA